MEGLLRSHFSHLTIGLRYEIIAPGLSSLFCVLSNGVRTKSNERENKDGSQQRWVGAMEMTTSPWIPDQGALLCRLASSEFLLEPQYLPTMYFTCPIGQ